MLRASIIVVLLVITGPVGAWGQRGHRIVGEIAMRHLTPKTRAAVLEMLGPHGLPRVSTWADEIRGKPEYRHTAPWHYINLGDHQKLKDVKRNPEGDVLLAMEKAEATLRDAGAGRAQKIEALKWLVHLVGDIHQPLHAGRAEDRGGNDIRLKWFGEKTNLHAVWDTKIIEKNDLSYTEYADFLDIVPKEQAARWRDSTFVDWIEEGQAVRPMLYDFGKQDGEEVELSWPYFNKAKPIVEERLAMAGIRLAARLNMIFDPR
ncbi:MAG: S1/P1 nuclease [Acidobacteriota bacterium]|nr:S1/P1 nuclease [Acidobacteriota bacterium]